MLIRECEESGEYLGPIFVRDGICEDSCESREVGTHVAYLVVFPAAAATVYNNHNSRCSCQSETAKSVRLQ